MPFTSPLPDVEIPDMPLTEHVLRKAGSLGDKPALIDGPTGRTLTFGQLQEMVLSVAGGLSARGFGPGDVFAILSPNVPEYAVAFHAVVSAGGTVTTINPTYTVGEIAHQLNDSGATHLVTIPEFVDNANAAAEQSRVEHVFVFGDSDRVAPFTSLMGAPLERPLTVNPSEALAVLPYSSGTTGLSKGVMLTHRNLLANLAQCEPALALSEDEVGVAVLPFFHIYGMQVLMNGAIAQGNTIVTMPRFDLEQFLQLCDRYRITRYYVVPPIVLALAKHPSVAEYDLSAARQVFSGAAPLGAELAAEASARIGCEVVQGYGLTESSPVTHSTLVGGYKPGSIGVLLPNQVCKIVDPVTGEELGVGENGELWIKGPNIMKGYLNNPSATAATVDDEGYLHTGDIGHVDGDGHYFIVDRLKELIKYKGFQVAPAELEALLITHPAVADIAVIPVPDEEAGEIPKAFVVLKPGAAATGEELMAFVADQVAHYKQVRSVEFVEEIPKSASGKILRRLLRDRPRSD